MSSLTDQIKGNWNVIKGKIKQEYADIKDDDLRYAEGKEDELIGRLQQKMGKTKEQITEWINNI